MVTCKRCDQPLPGDKQHADAAECFTAMRGAIGGARLGMQASIAKIQACRSVNHVPNKPIRLGRGTVCKDCIALGFATFEAVAQLLIHGSVQRQPPPVHIPLKIPARPPEAPAPPVAP